MIQVFVSIQLKPTVQLPAKGNKSGSDRPVQSSVSVQQLS